MQGSRTRVLDVMHGRTPDRIPLYELIRNDAVVRHFTRQELTVENAAPLLYKTFRAAVDTTRSVRLPAEPSDEILPDGRRRLTKRWTQWTEHSTYKTSEDYAAAKRAELDAAAGHWTEADAEAQRRSLDAYREISRQLGDDFFFFAGGPCLGLMGIYGEIGLEQFCYYLADCPGIIEELIKRNAEHAVLWVENLSPDHGIEAVFSGDDIAFNGGPLLSPRWFRDHYMPHLKRVNDAYHRRGIRVNFHSDGNLMPIMDDLVDAGIDLLNPIETAAGMDIAEIRRRYPDLVLTGGIDVSTLLPFGSPSEVHDATIRAIEDAEGRIMIGSSTELHNDVPLANFLAMRDAVLSYSL